MVTRHLSAMSDRINRFSADHCKPAQINHINDQDKMRTQPHIKIILKHILI